MASKTDSNEVILTALNDAIDEAHRTQAKIESLSNVNDNDYRLNAQNERELFDKRIDDYLEVTTSHVIKLKTYRNTQRNMLVAINKLPVEVLTRVITLIDSPKDSKQPAYISYTWVCHHWRNVLIENPYFWRSFYLHLGSHTSTINPFNHEFLQRSKSSALEFTLEIESMESTLASNLQGLIAKNSHRISWLYLAIDQTKLIEQVFENQSFPRLFSVNYDGPSRGLVALLPILVASDKLQILQCPLNPKFPVHLYTKLAIILNRLQHLSLTIRKPEHLECVLDALHNNVNLQELQLEIQCMNKTPFKDILLPGLEALVTNDVSILQQFRAPKLSGLGLKCAAPLPLMDYQIIKEFDLSSIKYMYLVNNTDRRGIHSILGMNERFHPTPLFSTRTEGFTTGDTLRLEQFEGALTVTDITANALRREFFNFKFPSDDLSDDVMGPMFSFILPRMKNLTELYLLSTDAPSGQSGVPLDVIVTRIPNIEKLIIRAVDGLENFIPLLNDPSVCPRLKHLSYIMSNPVALIQQNPQQYAENIGKILTECLQSRHKVLGDTLKFVALGNCPHLSDTGRKELERLGATVVTELCLVGNCGTTRKLDIDRLFYYSTFHQRIHI